jgi:hypothetical protein
MVSVLGWLAVVAAIVGALAIAIFFVGPRE